MPCWTRCRCLTATHTSHPLWRTSARCVGSWPAGRQHYTPLCDCMWGWCQPDAFISSLVSLLLTNHQLKLPTACEVSCKKHQPALFCVPSRTVESRSRQPVNVLSTHCLHVPCACVCSTRRCTTAPSRTPMASGQTWLRSSTGTSRWGETRQYITIIHIAPGSCVCRGVTAGFAKDRARSQAQGMQCCTAKECR